MSLNWPSGILTMKYESILLIQAKHITVYSCPIWPILYFYWLYFLIIPRISSDGFNGGLCGGAVQDHGPWTAVSRSAGRPASDKLHWSGPVPAPGPHFLYYPHVRTAFQHNWALRAAHRPPPHPAPPWASPRSVRDKRTSGTIHLPSWRPWKNSSVCNILITDTHSPALVCRCLTKITHYPSLERGGEAER